jgi:hypothetical protein
MVHSGALDGAGQTWVRISVSSIEQLIGRTITPAELAAAHQRRQTNQGRSRPNGPPANHKAVPTKRAPLPSGMDNGEPHDKGLPHDTTGHPPPRR